MNQANGGHDLLHIDSRNKHARPTPNGGHGLLHEQTRRHPGVDLLPSKRNQQRVEDRLVLAGAKNNRTILLLLLLLLLFLLLPFVFKVFSLK